MAMNEKEIKILISYHRHNIEWRDLFANGLKPFQEQGQIYVFDGEVTESSQKLAFDEEHLSSFEVIILCISKKYLSLKNFIEKEIPEKILPLQKSGTRVIPVYIEDCPWQSINWLHEIRLWPSPQLPFSNMSIDEREKYISRFIKDKLKLGGAEKAKSTYGKGKHGEVPYSGEEGQGGKFKDVSQLSEAFKKFLVEKKDYDKSFMLQHERDGGFDDSGIDKGKRQYMAIFDPETQKQLAIVEFGLKEDESTIRVAWQYHMHVKRNAGSADIEGYCVFPVAAGLGEKFSIIKFDKDGKGYESLLCEDFPTYEDLRRKREKETEASVGKGGDNSRNDDWRKDFTRFLTEEKKWLEIDFANEKYKTMAIDLSIRHPESKKLIAVIDFKESIDRNIESKAKASFAQFAELELGKYLVTPSSEKSNYSFTIYKYSDRGLVRMQPSDFPAYEESEPETPDEKLTLSNFESKLDVDGIKIFNEVIDSAESSSIGLDIQITDESYINLRSSWTERKTDNVVMQIHRYGEPDTRIALAVAGIKTGATMSTKPKLNDHITKGVMLLLSGYEKGIAGEIAWLNGNLPVKGTREKASVYVIEREIVNNPEALNGVEELLEWAVENFDKSPPDEQMEASIAGNSLSDQPAKLDKLGFEPYTSAIAKFLSDKDTIPPLTMSIEGEWGSGKSSFMIQLQGKLKENGGLIVNFSPWRHDKEDSVWAAFVLTFVKQLSKSLGWWDAFKANIGLLRQRFDWRLGWPSLIKFFAQIMIIIGVTLFLLKGNIPFIDSNATKVILRMAGIFGVAWGVMKKAQDYVGNPLKHDLKKYIQTPDYAGRICFVEKFHNDFEKVVETYARDKNIYVFIDDLDRCNVPKAAELMQSINLMISDDPKIIFIIGMDREKVAAGIAVKHRELIQYLYPETKTQKENWQSSSEWHNGLRYGYSYVEKFIQVPFDIPRPTVDQIENMLSDNKLSIPSKPKIKEEPTITTKTVDNSETYLKETKEIKSRPPLKLEKDSEEVKNIIRMVSPALDCNPRKAKQFVNLFRLKAYIIYETDLSFMSGFDSKGLTLEQLGKIVAISLNWPLLLGNIAKDKSSFSELIKYAETKDRKKEDSLSREITKHWGKDEQLMELISFNSMRGDSMPHQWTTYTLTDVNIDKLLEVSPKVRDIEATSEL